MPAHLLTPEAVAKLKRTIQKVANDDRASYQRRKRAGLQTYVYICKTGAGGVAALSGTTPGNGEVTVYKINTSGTLETQKKADGTDLTLDAYNISSAAVAADTFIQVKQESLSGKYLIDFEDC